MTPTRTGVSPHPRGWAGAAVANLPALLLVMLLAGTTILLAPVPAAAAPSIQVTPDTDLDPAGHTVTVRGDGYDTTKGIYVAWCVVPPPGQVPSPCGGGADQEGTSESSVWVSSNPPPYGVGLARPYGLGGTFEVDLVVTRWINDEVDCLVTACAVTTRNDHTRTNDRSQDVFHPVSFRAEPTTQPEQPQPTQQPQPPASTPQPEQPQPQQPRPAQPQPEQPQPTQQAQVEPTQQPRSTAPASTARPASPSSEPRATQTVAPPIPSGSTAPLDGATPEALVAIEAGGVAPVDASGTSPTPVAPTADATDAGSPGSPASSTTALVASDGEAPVDRGPLILLAALLTSSTGVAAIRQKRREP
ncbi:hypothetical protein [Euzebya rosea]|uniref:hypothetical protein n=1 Tax=Euzebya rosea TaxID=2052804 RepID=UPI000D3E54B4|nr:hypothetical protein [Euzebya rosea]